MSSGHTLGTEKGETVIGAVTMLVGSLLMVFHKRFVRLVARHQEAFWGFHYTARKIRLAEIVSVIVGAGFVVAGLLTLLQFIQPK
jgi:hypothetical protein